MKRWFLIKFAQFDLWHWSCLCFSFSDFSKFLCNNCKLDTLLLCNSLKYCLKPNNIYFEMNSTLWFFTSSRGPTVLFPSPVFHSTMFPKDPSGLLLPLAAYVTRQVFSPSYSRRDILSHFIPTTLNPENTHAYIGCDDSTRRRWISILQTQIPSAVSGFGS